MGSGSTNYSYVWVVYPDDSSKGSYFLVDTGADISILPLKVFQEMSEVNKTEIRDSGREIFAGNKQKCDVRGVADTTISLNRKILKHKFFVCADATCPILGNDFMEKHDLHYRPASRTMKLGNQVIECYNPKGLTATSKVCLIRSYTIAPKAEAIIPCSISPKANQNGKVCQVEKTITCLAKTGALVCRTTCVPENNKVPVRVMNATAEPIRLWKGSVMGISEPVVACADLPSGAGNELCRCTCKCVPGQTQELPDLPCCHELEQRPTNEEKYQYLRLNQHVAVDTYRQFE
jgi:predicted aspartyl protease